MAQWAHAVELMYDDRNTFHTALHAADTLQAAAYLAALPAFDSLFTRDELFCLRVQGESMIDVGILDGDIIVVRQQETAENGEIIVAMIEDEATVKRYSRRNGQVWLLPENEAYSPIDGHDAQILGKVAAVIRRY